MSQPNASERRFAEHLSRLEQHEDRAALAALRRGLGASVGAQAAAYPYVIPWMPSNAPPWVLEAYELTGALFALHRGSWAHADGDSKASNLGASFAWLARESGSEQSIERRFVALLNADRDELPSHLRHAVALLKSHEVPIDWAQFVHDVQHWGDGTRGVQSDWARAFWGGASEVTPELGGTEKN